MQTRISYSKKLLITTKCSTKFSFSENRFIWFDWLDSFLWQILPLKYVINCISYKKIFSKLYFFELSQAYFFTVVYVVPADTWLTNCVWQTLHSDSFDTIPILTITILFHPFYIDNINTSPSFLHILIITTLFPPFHIDNINILILFPPFYIDNIDTIPFFPYWLYQYYSLLSILKILILLHFGLFPSTIW